MNLKRIGNALFGAVVVAAMMIEPATPAPVGQGQAEVVRETINAIRENPKPNIAGYTSPYTKVADVGNSYLGIAYTVVGRNWRVEYVAPDSPAWFSGFTPGEILTGFYLDSAYHDMTDAGILRPGDRAEFVVRKETHFGTVSFLRPVLLGPSEEAAYLEFLNLALENQDRYPALGDALRNVFLARPSLGFGYRVYKYGDSVYWQVTEANRYIGLLPGDKITAIYALPSGRRLNLDLNLNFWDSVNWPVGRLVEMKVVRQAMFGTEVNITVRTILAPNRDDMKFQ